jgi:hypothetical protein
MTPPIDPISSSTDPLSVVPPVTPPASLTASSQITTHTTGTSSMLDQIMQTARESSLPPPVTPATSLGGWSVPPIQPQPPRQRDPMTAGTIMRLLGSLLLVIMIFFGSFLAYIYWRCWSMGVLVQEYSYSPSSGLWVCSELYGPLEIKKDDDSSVGWRRVSSGCFFLAYWHSGHICSEWYEIPHMTIYQGMSWSMTTISIPMKIREIYLHS